jgi:hypothetical protein
MTNFNILLSMVLGVILSSLSRDFPEREEEEGFAYRGWSYPTSF